MSRLCILNSFESCNRMRATVAAVVRIVLRARNDDRMDTSLLERLGVTAINHMRNYLRIA